MKEARIPTLRGTSYPELGILRRGKVRDSYVAGGRRYLIASDRVSAFDVVFDECIPHKGRVLNEITAHFTELARNVVPCAFESRPHPSVIVARECPTYPIEVIVRGYLCGSAWQAYEQGERVLSGVRLAGGLTKNARIDPPIITPTTKAETGHDIPISRAEIVERGIVPEETWLEIERMARILFAQGTKAASDRGLVLLDTKYEFGAGPEGPVLIDEVHTPDSSRYVHKASFEANPQNPEALSKEFLRDWLRAQGYTGQEGVPAPHLTPEIVSELSRRYLALCKQLTGKEPDLRGADAGDPHLQIFEALKRGGHLHGYVTIVVCGSPSDSSGARRVMDALAGLGVPSCLRIVSGHRDPHRLLDLIEWADRYPGEVVWVDVTGLSNAKGPLVAASTLNPVYHCAFEATSPDVLSSLNLPGGVPLAVVASPRNVALVVAKALGVHHPEVRRRVASALRTERERGREADLLHAAVRAPDPEPPEEGT